MAGAYETAFRRSLDEREAFWAEAAADLHWYKAPTQILETESTPAGRWFVDGVTNTCFNALDRHVEAGRGEQAAMIYDSPVTDTVRSFTYRELRDAVATFAGALKSRGIGKGDRVVIYMPMIPETAIAMLACARLGAVHSVVFGGFASNELAVRIDDSACKAVIAASCGIEPGRVVEYKPLLDGAIDLAAHKPEFCVVFQRPECEASMVEGRDVDWHEAVAGAEPADCVPVSALDPLYILYTSGTTGQPKGVVRDNGGHMVVLHWTMKNVYGVEPGRSSGPPPTSAGSSAIPTSSMRRCWPATRPSCSRASRSAHRMRASIGASSSSTRWPRCSPRPRPSGRSAGTIPRRNCSKDATSRISARCSWQASAATRTR